jgi:hypothetical protein
VVGELKVVYYTEVCPEVEGIVREVTTHMRP